MSSPTSPSFTSHRPILATSSSFHDRASPSPARTNRRREPTHPPPPTDPSSPTPSPKGSMSRASYSGGGFSPPFSSGSGWSANEKGKGREGELPVDKVNPDLTSVRRPGLAVVLEDVIKSSNGRDKVFKLIQYTIKLYLYTRTWRKIRPSPLDVRLKSTQNGLSLTRRCLLLFNPVSPLLHLLSPLESFASIVPDTIDLIGGISDDVYTLSRLGLVGNKLGGKADRWSNRFWLLTTLISLSHLSVSTPSLTRRIVSMERHQEELGIELSGDVAGGDGGLSDELKKLRSERDAERMTALKLWFDFIFVIYDIMGWKTFKDPVQIFAGLGAGLVGTSKLVSKHRVKLMKA